MTDLQINYLRSPERVQQLLRLDGYKQRLATGVLGAALERCRPATPRGQLLSQTKGFFRSKAVIVPAGLDELPSCWLQQLPILLWRSRKSHWKMLPYMICSLGVEDGVLWIAFAQEQPADEIRLTCWDKLRIHLNLNLLPNLWCPLSHDLEKWIWDARPKLRSDLFRLTS